jgi:signal transduction histidine kinase
LKQNKLHPVLIASVITTIIIIFVTIMYYAFIFANQDESEEKFLLSTYENIVVNDNSIESILNLNKSEWIESNSKKLNFGHTINTVWLKINSETLSEGFNVIDLKFNMLDYVYLYTVNRKTKEVIKKQLSGDRLELKDKTYSSEKVIFGVYKNLDLDIYINIDTRGSNQTPIVIKSLKKHVENIDSPNNLLHMFLGFALFAIVLYCASLIIYQDKTFFYAILVTLSLGILLIFYYRMNIVYFPFFNIEYQHKAIILPQILTAYGIMKYIQFFLKQGDFSPFDKTLRVLGIFSVFIFGLCLYLPYDTSLTISFIYLAIIGTFTFWMQVYYIYKKKNSQHIKPAGLLLFSWLSLSTGACIQILGEIGILHHTNFTNQSLLLGSMIIVFCFGLLLFNNLILELKNKIIAESSLVIANQKLLEEYQKKISAQQSLAIANEKLSQTSKLKAISSMASGIIHEIKNPLNWSKGSLSLAIEEITEYKEKVDINEISEMMGDCLEGITRIESIVNGLNWFAKANKLALKNDVHLRGVVDNTLNIAKSTLRSIKIENNISEEITVLASETHLSQVIINILSNSVKGLSKVSQTREGKITINASSLDDGRVFLSWLDNGIGINKDKVTDIFEAWCRADNYDEGVGLGMTITKQIIDKHNGEITIKSEEGKWTEVKIYLQKK